MVSARSPITGEDLFDVPGRGRASVQAAIAAAKAAFAQLAHRAGAGPRRAGQALRRAAAPSTRPTIAELITIEAGKIPSEALGEVQEMIDICDFAVGLSRQLDGRTMPSRAAEPPADGDLAPARCGRRDLRLQLPRRGVVLEYRGRAGLRRHRRLEALADDAADLARRARPCSTARSRECGMPRRGCTSS